MNIYISAAIPDMAKGNGKGTTDGFKWVGCKDIEELATIANRHNICTVKLRDGHRHGDNIISASNLLKLDCDAPGEADIVHEKLVEWGITFIKKPSASNKKAPYKWHFLILTDKPHSIYPAAYRQQAIDLIDRLGAKVDAASTNIVQNFAPAILGMSAEEADKLTFINYGMPWPLIEPDKILERPAAKLKKASVIINDNPGVVGKIKKILPNGNKILDADSFVPVNGGWIRAGDIEIDEGEILHCGCPVCNPEHTGDPRIGYGYGIRGKEDGAILLYCSGNKCRKPDGSPGLYIVDKPGKYADTPFSNPFMDIIANFENLDKFIANSFCDGTNMYYVKGDRILKIVANEKRFAMVLNNEFECNISTSLEEWARRIDAQLTDDERAVLHSKTRFRSKAVSDDAKTILDYVEQSEKLINDTIFHVQQRRQYAHIQYQRDMFADGLTIEAHGDTLIIKGRFFYFTPFYYDHPKKDLIGRIQKQHWQGKLKELLQASIAALFARNKKRTYVHIVLPSDFGKDVYRKIFQELGLVLNVDLSAEEMLKSPSPISREMVLGSAWLIFNEFKAFKHDMKKWDSSVLISSKNRLGEQVDVGMKWLINAERSHTLMGEVDDQIANRVSIIEMHDTRTMGDCVRESGVGYTEHDKILKALISDFIEKELKKYYEAGRDRAADMADAVLEEFYKINTIKKSWGYEKLNPEEKFIDWLLTTSDEPFRGSANFIVEHNGTKYIKNAIDAYKKWLDTIEDEDKRKRYEYKRGVLSKILGEVVVIKHEGKTIKCYPIRQNSPRF